MENLDLLVNELRAFTEESEWLEFKHNNDDPEMIGKDISALANGAAYTEKTKSYMVWGIDDSTHDVIGTTFNPLTLKVNGQELVSWLRNMLSPNAEFEFHSFQMKNSCDEYKDMVVLIIYKAAIQTVTFKKADYIRIGSYTKPLNDHPGIKAQLWDRLRSEKYEEIIALKDLNLPEALDLIDFSKYFELKELSIPSTQDNILHYMLEDSILAKQDNGLYGVTNLGAILFAKNLSSFPRLSRKAIRVVKYEGNNKLQILKEYTGNKGYAVGFEGLMDFLKALLPSKEIIEAAVRKTSTQYPMNALREAIANALIHQDFSMTGTGPLVEIFDTRIEITNPGTPLVDIKRIIDNPPKSRNEKLADLMRRLKMCEELGSGWDRIAISCEMQKLPAPRIEVYNEDTKVTLYSEISFTNISPEDKIWACYLHACVKYVSGECINNKSIRDRFGLKESSSASVSRLLKDTFNRKLIKPLDSETAPRYMKYMPYWA